MSQQESDLPDGFDWSQLIPDVDLPTGGLQGGVELLKDIGIQELYWRWIGKMDPRGSTRVESIMVSCPKPDHPDKNPSAWLNREKHVWHCAVCGEGGDIMDLAAIRFNSPYRQTGDPKDFSDLLEQALVDVGVDVEALREQNGAISIPSVQVPSSNPHAATLGDEDEEEDTDYGDDETDGLIDEASLLDWRTITEAYPDSFLSKWMDAVTPSDSPDEYLWWLGMQMVGLAVGRDCWLSAPTPVYPNLLLALIGRTGNRKSRSTGLANQILAEALPFDSTDATSKGVQLLERPASGEALFDMFHWVPEGEDDPHPVRGLIDVDELTELMAVARKKGSTLRESIISFFDGKETIGIRSRTGGSIKVNSPFMSMVVGGQPDAMRDILSANDAHSGFANRFLFVAGTRKPRQTWLDRPRIKLTGLAGKLQAIHAWAKTHAVGPEQGAIDLEDAAAPLLDKLFDDLDQIREQPNGDIFARLDLYAMKLVVILCANAKVDLATPEMIRHVEHLIFSVVPSSMSVSEAINDSEENWYRTRVLEFLQRRERQQMAPPSMSDIRKSFTASKRKDMEIGAAVKHLEFLGFVQRVKLDIPTGRGRPPGPRFMLVHES